MRHSFTASFLFLGLLFLSINPSFAQENLGEGEALPIVLEADHIQFDRELGIVTARGKIIVSHEGRMLYADTLSYNQNTDLISASGNVELHEATGEILQTQYMTLDSAMHEGVVEALFYKLDATARLAANGARRSEGRYTEMAKGVYSTCAACQENPNRPLLWQMNANRVLHDAQEKTISYYDVTLNMYGVPVFYTPYFSHADPSVKHKSGLLMPSFGNNNEDGWFLKQPYYYNISQHEDLTITPIFNEDLPILLEGEYRKQIKNGGFVVDLAISEDEINAGDDFDGFIHSKGEINLNKNWRTSYDITQLDDIAFFDENPYFSEFEKNYFENNIMLEGFNQQNYVKLETLWFEDLREDNDTEQPLLLPQMTFDGQSKADKYGGRFHYEAHLREILDDETVKNGQRISLEGSYNIPFLLPLGLVAQNDFGIRGDLYHTQFTTQALDEDDALKDGTLFRAIPSLNSKVKYPLSRRTQYGTQALEPMLALIAMPNDVGNDEAIPNSDSSIFETNDTNLFVQDRSVGRDLIDGGTRFVIGANFSHYFLNDMRFKSFFGQSTRLSGKEELEEELGIEETSDVVGRMQLNTTQYGNYYYKFTLSPEDGSFLKNEASFDFGEPAFNMNGGYSFVDQSINNADVNFERIYAGVSSQFTKDWRSNFSLSYDIESNDSINNKLALIYEDECFIFSSSFTTEFNQDDENEQRYLLQFTFKSLGGFTYDEIVDKEE